MFKDIPIESARLKNFYVKLKYKTLSLDDLVQFTALARYI